jgi:molybdate transport system ATP-binding protein
MSLHCEVEYHYATGFHLRASFETDAQVTALFGPSGSGKTTILETIAGFRRPQRGRIALDGQTVVDTDAHVWLPPERRHITLVAQDQLLFSHLTARQNLLYGRRQSLAADCPSFERLVEILELGPVLDRRPGQLSGGERQRVALGRAALAAPRLLLLDEPLGAVDEPLKARILDYLERLLRAWSIQVVFVTHSQEDVRRIAQTAIVLDQGCVVSQGSVDQALAQPAPLSWHNSVGPVNLLRVDAIQSVDNRLIGRVGGQPVQLPPTSATGATSRLIAFSPRDVILARGDVTGLSARNHLQGQVRRMIELPSAIFAEIDVGQPIWSEVTRDAVRELQLAVGARVICLIKTQSFRFVT